MIKIEVYVPGHRVEIKHKTLEINRREVGRWEHGSPILEVADELNVTTLISKLFALPVTRIQVEV